MRTAILIGVMLLLAPVDAQAQTSAPATKLQRLEKAFFEAATKLFSRVVQTIPEGERKQVAKLLGASDEDLAAKMAEKFLVNSAAFLEVTEKDADLLLAGRFDDQGNRRKVAAAADVLGGLGIRLPAPIHFMMDRGASGELKGMELELAARILVGQAKLVRAAIDRAESQRQDNPRVPQADLRK